MDLFDKVHDCEPMSMKVHTFEPNIRLIRLFSLMLNYAKPRIFYTISINGKNRNSRCFIGQDNATYCPVDVLRKYIPPGGLQ